MYAVPSDQADAGLDTDGTIEASVAAMQAYLRSQTGGPGLKLDTSGGALDVTFVRLPRTDAEYAAQSEVARALAVDLRPLFGRGDKIFAVYYEGTASGPNPDFTLCGEGGALAELAISVVVLHNTCGYDLGSSRAGVPGAAEFVLLHESLHAMRFVPNCARHATNDEHVSDSTQDLMAPFLPSGTPILDVNHDDYFQANLPGCLDLTQSRFLEGAGTTVSLASNGHGRIEGEAGEPDFLDIACPPACSATFDGGHTVTIALAAVPDPGYTFVRWQGACSGAAPACTFKTTASTAATAVFARAPVQLAVSVAGGGSVVSTPAGLSCPPRCSGVFAAASKVRLRAKPRAGWRFVAWSGACKGRAPCFVQLSRPASVRATFRRG